MSWSACSSRDVHAHLVQVFRCILCLPRPHLRVVQMVQPSVRCIFVAPPWVQMGLCTWSPYKHMVLKFPGHGGSVPDDAALRTGAWNDFALVSSCACGMLLVECFSSAKTCITLVRSLGTLSRSKGESCETNSNLFIDSIPGLARPFLRRACPRLTPLNRTISGIRLWELEELKGTKKHAMAGPYAYRP